MTKFKLVALSFSGLMVLGAWGTSAFASSTGIECDESCQQSIAFQNDIDSKSMSIELLKKELDLLRLTKEIESIKGGESRESRDSEELKLLSDKIDALSERFNNEVVELKGRTTERSMDFSEVVIDTTGIENVYVTATSSIAGEWSSQVFYDNSIQKLYLGEHVFPGAVITKIDRRGAEISYDGKVYHKTITPSEIAQARAFNNIREEREQKRGMMNRQDSYSGDHSFIPNY